ncbi:MAG: acyltransferase [Bacteroidales bacterium]|nr:acyltransferase [Bacteroidales bacterium]
MNFLKQRNDIELKLKSKSYNDSFDEEFAMQIFHYQFYNNKIYQEFCNYLHRNPSSVKAIEEIPFLPISLFKTHKIITGNPTIAHTFLSSATTGMERSKHFLADEELYKLNAVKTFERFYGSLNEFVILALLPSYLEQGNSSLVFMIDEFIRLTNNSLSGFFLEDFSLISTNIQRAQQENKKVILWGVSYALLDYAEVFDLKNVDNLIVLETGGMKGRRREMLKEELHLILTQAFSVETIHSEYGMTELLSQAYSKGYGLFEPAATMKILIRDINDPLTLESLGKTGGLNVIDLANIDSCAFIATQDLGKRHQNGNFEVQGRFDNSDVRGCNLLVG